MSHVPFTFDTNFDGARPAREKVSARKSLSGEEIEAIKAEAYREGLQAGEVRAAEAVARSVKQLTANITGAIDREIEVIRAEGAELAFACAKKLAGAALAAAPEAEIAEALRAALYQALSETHITVKTAPSLVHALDKEAAEIAAHEGYDGRIRFVADPTLHGADCRIEWRGGGMERAQIEIEQAVAELIQRRFSTSSKE